MRSNPKRIRFAEIAAVIVILASAFAAPAAGAEMRMVALDVGEGQAVLFVKNGRGLLVDAGPPHRAAEMVRDIRAYGVKRLDWLVLTHLHPDHAGGLFRVIEEWPEVRIAENGHRPDKGRVPDLARWAVQVMEKHGSAAVGAGDTFCWQGARLHFLWPEKIRGSSLNRHSLVFYLSYAGERVLIMGDAGTGVEKKLLKKGAFDKGADVLVAGHHGSKNTSSAKFLKTVAPGHSIICINKNNFRGYPAKDTVERLEKFSRKVHMTWHGDVVISLD